MSALLATMSAPGSVTKGIPFVAHGDLQQGMQSPPSGTAVDGQQLLVYQGNGNVALAINPDLRGLTQWEMTFTGPHNGVIQSNEWLSNPDFFLTGTYTYTTSVDFVNGDRETQQGSFTVGDST